MVLEILKTSNSKIHSIYALASWMEKHQGLLRRYASVCTTVSERELKSVSALTTPNQVCCVVEIPDVQIDENVVQHDLSIVLDHIQDPGNMGTILRTADWFGIQHIFCFNCVDVYNPKVVQATMGAFLRVKTITTTAADLFGQFSSLPVYGAYLDGDNVFNINLSKKGFIIIGNEGRGMSEETAQFVTQKITIPAYGQAESLNAAVAAGVLCAAFRQVRE